MQIDINDNIFNKHHLPLYKNSSYYLVLYGGAGSGKSFFAGQKVLLRMITEESHRFLFVRKVGKTIRNSQFLLMKDLVYMYGLQKYFKFRENDMEIEYIPNRNKIICMGIDDREKVKSIQGITSIWIEEATELEREDLLQLDLRIRGKFPNYKQIMITFNPVTPRHWLKRYFFDTKIKNATVNHSTYINNKFLGKEDRKKYENFKHIDLQYYNVYCLGLWGEMKNRIYTNVLYLDKEEYLKEYDEVIYGIDFGFNNPNAVVKIGIKDSYDAYIEEIAYEKFTTNNELISTLREKGILSTDYLYADGAEPDRIKEIRTSGFFIKGSDKSAGTVKNGIDYCKRFRIFTCKENLNFNNEIELYKWREKDGEVLDEPVKANDHLLDAMRNALYTHAQREEIKMWIM